MLLGRKAEAARIDRLLAAARRGESGALLLRGEPGIGKSALCRYALERAPAMTTLEVRGLESEVELPFAGLSVLLAPVIDRLESIPEPQAAALAGALGLSAPIPGDPLTVYAATLSVLAAAADEAPLVVVVDDAHWLDQSSGQALLFVARRLHSEGIALLLTARTGEAFSSGGSELAELELSGLSMDASMALLTEATHGRVTPAVGERLHDATAGNPLALAEICAQLSDDQLAGGQPVEDPLPAGPSLQRALRRRSTELPVETQRAVLIAAASDSEAMHPIAAAIRSLDMGVEALEPAETAGLIEIEVATLAFRHPLLRSAVYHGATPPERRAAHAALAGALSGDRDAGRRAWHLAHAAVAPDENIAEALESAAMDARQRSGSAAAATAFERAATFSITDEQRSRRLFEAAIDYDLAGQLDRAIALLGEALSYTVDPLLRADIHNLRGRLDSWRRPTQATQRLLLEEAERVEAVDPARATLLLVNATTPSFLLGDTAQALAIAERAYAVGERVGGPMAMLAALPLACALILRGDSRRARELLTQCRPLVDQGDVFMVAPLAGQLMQCLAWVEDYATADTVGQRVVGAARKSSAPGVLRLVLAFRSELDFRLGRWSEAYAHATEALRLAREAGSGTELAYSLTCLARIDAAQGREADCRAHVEEAREVFADRGIASTLSYGQAALGLLELGLGHVDRAIEQLELVAALNLEHGLGHPNVIPWRPDLVEAYARAGRREEAEVALATLEQEADSADSAWARGTAARCRGLLAPEDDFEAHFAKALEYQSGASAAFDRARTELCLGERLRRSKRRIDARKALRQALVAFERVGATPWAERAQAELKATGETARRRDVSLSLQLTPQELQVALTVAGGATNREAAAALFLSPKTVEFHLGRVYRKLNIRSRSELAREVASREARGQESLEPSAPVATLPA